MIYLYSDVFQRLVEDTPAFSIVQTEVHKYVPFESA